jgi:hypothetical protein
VKWQESDPIALAEVAGAESMRSSAVAAMAKTLFTTFPLDDLENIFITANL